MMFDITSLVQQMNLLQTRIALLETLVAERLIAAYKAQTDRVNAASAIDIEALRNVLDQMFNERLPKKRTTKEPD